jgi:hypothetical protein
MACTNTTITVVATATAMEMIQQPFFWGIVVSIAGMISIVALFILTVCYERHLEIRGRNHPSFLYDDAEYQAWIRESDAHTRFTRWRKQKRLRHVVITTPMAAQRSMTSMMASASAAAVGKHTRSHSSSSRSNSSTTALKAKSSPSPFEMHADSPSRIYTVDDDDVEQHEDEQEEPLYSPNAEDTLNSP